MTLRKRFMTGVAAAVGAVGLTLLPMQPLDATPSATAAKADQSLLAKMCHEMVSLVQPGTAMAADCPTPTPGSATNETGTYQGTFYDYVDAYSTDSGANFQHQHSSTLTTKALGCQHYRNNEKVASEVWLIPNQISWNPDNVTTAPSAPGTYTIGVDTLDADGVTHHIANATIVPTNKSCGITQQRDATSGTVTWTQIDTTMSSGHYDLWFGTDHVTGDFVAPWCTLCQTRPSRTTCLKV